MDTQFRFENFRKSRAFWSICRFALWIVIFNGALCGSEAASSTLYVENLCKAWSSALVDLRHHRSGTLISLASDIQIETCNVQLNPSAQSSVVLSIYKYNFEPQDQLIIEDADKFKVSLVGHGDFSDERKSFQSNGKMTLHYIKNGTSLPVSGSPVKFQFTFTDVHKAPCGFEEYECRNLNCVHEDLVCDRHNNCGDNSDEADCGPRKKGDEKQKVDNEVTVVHRQYSSVLITLIIICGVLLATVVIIFVSVLIGSCVNKRKQAKKAAATPLSTVASSVPPQSPTAVHPDGQQLPVVPSVHTHDGQPSHVARREQSIQQTAPERKPDYYQVPSMYPAIPSAPECNGIDNPEFNADE